MGASAYKQWQPWTCYSYNSSAALRMHGAYLLWLCCCILNMPSCIVPHWVTMTCNVFCMVCCCMLCSSSCSVHAWICWKHCCNAACTAGLPVLTYFVDFTAVVAFELLMVVRSAMAGKTSPSSVTLSNDMLLRLTPYPMLFTGGTMASGATRR